MIQFRDCVGLVRTSAARSSTPPSSPLNTPTLRGEKKKNGIRPRKVQSISILITKNFSLARVRLHNTAVRETSLFSPVFRLRDFISFNYTRAEREREKLSIRFGRGDRRSKVKKKKKATTSRRAAVDAHLTFIILPQQFYASRAPRDFYCTRRLCFMQYERRRHASNIEPVTGASDLYQKLLRIR